MNDKPSEKETFVNLHIYYHTTKVGSVDFFFLMNKKLYSWRHHKIFIKLIANKRPWDPESLTILSLALELTLKTKQEVFESHRRFVTLNLTSLKDIPFQFLSNPKSLTILSLVLLVTLKTKQGMFESHRRFVTFTLTSLKDIPFQFLSYWVFRPLY